MVEHGGIFDKNLVKMLILDILKKVDVPLTFPQLNEIITKDGLVNYFLFAVALGELMESSHIDKLKTEVGEVYGLSFIGLESADLFEKNLPLSIRESVYATAKHVIEGKDNDSNIICSAVEKDGKYSVLLKITEGDTEMLSLSLYAANEYQAEQVCRNFRNSPDKIYSDIVTILTGFDN